MSWAVVKNQFKQCWISTCMSLVLFTGVTYFIIWSETQTIKRNLSLDELFDNAVSISKQGVKDIKYEGKIVYFIGPLNILEPISEPDYNIQVLAVKLRKRVQMYQWIEETTDTETPITEPGEEYQKLYWYHKDWRDSLVDSSSFMPGHSNPKVMPILSEMHIAENVMIGSAMLGLDLKRKVNDYYEIWSDSRPERTDIKLHSGFYYHGESALEHEIGDLRIHFTYAGRQEDIYTAVGVLERGTINAYISKSFPHNDPLSVLRKGSFSLKHMREMEKSDANINTWKYRILGFIQVVASVMTLHPGWLSMLLRCRWISNKLRRSSRLWANIILALVFSLTVTTIPWLFYKFSHGLLFVMVAMLPVLRYTVLLEQRPDPAEEDMQQLWHDDYR